MTLMEVPEGATSQEQIHARLRHDLMVGRYPTGTVLTMRGLAEKLGVSATPVREALRRLSAEGAIQPLGNRRMIVPHMTRDRFEELIALRVTLERHAAARALPFVPDALIGLMGEIDEAMDEAMAGGEHDRLTVLNHRFHRALYAAAPHPVTLPQIESLWLQLGPFQREVIPRVGRFYKVDRHKQILSALIARDGGALARALSDDIEDGVARAGRAAFDLTGSGS